jgi:hypothetical protein
MSGGKSQLAEHSDRLRVGGAKHVSVGRFGHTQRTHRAPIDAMRATAGGLAVRPAPETHSSRLCDERLRFCASGRGRSSLTVIERARC